ncbi:hypothetical protein DPM13_03545 [Paracoccus mutanolyticus]|uniref:LysR substrate-binding domain-containing protein n=1 Tax=Paracoccus mutanolyticus TaxID=1499308 RepID=A0ABM6WPR1_9RHOB|nr:hypothetical protein DPM13_03545 [Paracoccus mutanolyticus]
MSLGAVLAMGLEAGQRPIQLGARLDGVALSWARLIKPRYPNSAIALEVARHLQLSFRVSG